MRYDRLMPAILTALWACTIGAKFAVIALAIRRRIPAPLFVLFFIAHTARSIYMFGWLRGEEYSSFRVATAPWFDGAAALVAVEAFALLCWRLPRFRGYGVGLFAGFSVVAAGVAAAGEVVWPWQAGPPAALLGSWEKAAGLGLAAMLGVSVLVMDRFRAVDRGAEHHAAALALQAISAAAAQVVAQTASPFAGSLVATGGALLAYVVWCWTVRGIRLDAETPQGPLNPREVEKAWGASA